MKKLLVAGLAAGLLTSAAPTAGAHPNHHYLGSCVLAVANDTTPGAQLGGPLQWNGAAAVAVVTTNAAGIPDPTLAAFARCDLYINGSFVFTLVSATGTGVAVGTQAVSFTAGLNDVVEVCENVNVNGDPHTFCKPVDVTRSVAQPISDIISTVLFAAYPLVDPLKHLLDPALCPLLALVPSVPPVLTVDPQGDVYVYGDQVYDCPPYGIGYPNLDKYAFHVMTWWD